MNPQHIHHIRHLSDEIDSLHQSYLQTEECLKKIGKQTQLEDVIRQYLSIVPHLKKFFFPKISYVLHNSIRDRKDFSPFKAISAWSALAKYAHNILTQPWRKEFYTIQKYGGYFSHVIKEVLVDWEIIFELMGYNTVRDIMILNKPIDPDKITFVARDCFIAQVECQIMMNICASVLKTHNDCTWQDILEFRENHTCSAEEAIRGLCDIFLQRHQEEYLGDTCLTDRPAYSYATLSPFHSTPCPRYNDYKQTPSFGNSIVSMTPHSKTGHDKCDFSQFVPRDYTYPNCAKHMIPNSVQFNESGYMPPYANRYGMPYGDKVMYPQYIYPNPPHYLCMDIDDRDHCSNCHRLNYGAMYPCIYDSNKYSDRSYDYHKQRNKNLGKNVNSVRQDMLDNMQRKGSKDTFLSGNVKCAPVTVTDLENAMKAFAYDFDKKTVSDSDQSDKTHLSNSVSDSGCVPSKQHDKKETFKSSNPDFWACEKCTFHNSSKQSICEMCSKSRKSGSEKIPLISGGRQCHNCTLVNERDAKTCEACKECLKDSPTYI